MRDFDEQLKAYGDEMKRSRCPYSEAELDREIRSVMWNMATAADGDVRVPKEHRLTAADGDVRVPRKRRLWPAIAAAACLLAVLIPLGARTSSSAAILDRVSIDGKQIYFACNNGCTADATIETFKTLMR